MFEAGLWKFFSFNIYFFSECGDTVLFPNRYIVEIVYLVFHFKVKCDGTHFDYCPAVPTEVVHSLGFQYLQQHRNKLSVMVKFRMGLHWD